jgi:AcrR family transcriptional regulator
MSERVKDHLPLSYRQRQALETQRLIVGAARRLFLDGGYASTTIERIAAEAGVAVSTVYAAFGSKRGILRQIRLAWHKGSQIWEVAYGLPPGTPPAERLRWLAQATRRQWESGAEVVAIYSGAAAADPEAAAELQEALKGRRAGLVHFAAGLQPHLRPGLSLEDAAAIICAMCLPEVHAEMVGESGCSEDVYQAWLEATLKQQLLP